MNVLSLEDFLDTPQSRLQAPTGDAAATNGDLESSRLAGYESGYQAGWDDALKSSEMEHTHISAEFARNLEELSFTFLEARRQVCLSLKPLVETLVRQVVPELMQANYKDLIEELLLPIVEVQGQATVDLICAPGSRSLRSRGIRARSTTAYSNFSRIVSAGGARTSMSIPSRSTWTV